MKKIWKPITLGVVAALLAISGYFGYNWYQENVSEASSMLRTITVEEYDKKISSQETFYVYVGSPSCGDSDAFDQWFFPEFRNNATVKKSLLYLNVKGVQSSSDSWDEFKLKTGIKTTPSLVFVENGKIADSISWSSKDGFKRDKVIEWMSRNNLQ